MKIIRQTHQGPDKVNLVIQNENGEKEIPLKVAPLLPAIDRDVTE